METRPDRLTDEREMGEPVPLDAPVETPEADPMTLGAPDGLRPIPDQDPMERWGRPAGPARSPLTSPRRPPTKKTTAKRGAARKTTAKRSTAKRSSAKRPSAKKSMAKRPTAKKSTAKKSTAKKSTAKRCSVTRTKR